MRILHISAHADDESLGCGGTLLHHQAQGHDLLWVIVTIPFTSSPEPWASQAIKKADERNHVAQAFGFKDRIELGFPPAALDLVLFGGLVDRLREAIARMHPDVIYTVWPADRHSDHQVVARAVLAAWPAWTGGVRALRMCETVSAIGAEAPFAPDLWVNITPYLDQKIGILGFYKTELRPPPHPRNDKGVRAWAAYRGAQVGVAAAEAFRTAWAIE